MSNLACVSGAFSEFLKVWSSGGSASLQLNSSNGGCDITFSAHLGHPGTTFQPSPTPPPTPSYRPRTPADKVRNQKRAAAHQESLSASVPSSPSTASLTSAAATSAPTPTPTVSVPSSSTPLSRRSASVKPVVGAAQTVACQPTNSVKESNSALSLLNCVNCEGMMSPAHQCASASEEKEQPAPLPLCLYCCHLGSGDHPVHYEQRCLCSERKCICQCYCTETQVEVKRLHFTQPTWNAGWKPLTTEERAQAHTFASAQDLKFYRGQPCTNKHCLD